MALSFCVAAGANVYVTSSDDSKITKAIRLGAVGGANYKEGTLMFPSFPFFIPCISKPLPTYPCLFSLYLLTFY